MNKKTIVVFGLNEDQIEDVETSLKTNCFNVSYINSLTDSIASLAEVLIVNSKAMSENDKEKFFDFYTESSKKADLTVYWLDFPVPPAQFRVQFHCHHYLDEIIYLLNDKFKNK